MCVNVELQYWELELELVSNQLFVTAQLQQFRLDTMIMLYYNTNIIVSYNIYSSPEFLEIGSVLVGRFL